MNNSYKYFSNLECKYFPCNKTDYEEFNCLFCYCPMYSIENCPGNKRYIEKEGRRIKVCTECAFPHNPDNYEKIMDILRQN